MGCKHMRCSADAGCMQRQAVDLRGGWVHYRGLGVSYRSSRGVAAGGWCMQASTYSIQYTMNDDAGCSGWWAAVGSGGRARAWAGGRAASSTAAFCHQRAESCPAPFKGSASECGNRCSWRMHRQQKAQTPAATRTVSGSSLRRSSASHNQAQHSSQVQAGQVQAAAATDMCFWM